MKKIFMIMVTLMCVSWAAIAQNRIISGTVVDAANNEPLIGATVSPIGGGQGAATDLEGSFTINVPANVKSAKISYVGYKEETVALHNGMKVRLESTSTDLTDVVVVAYGTANKESLTGSVAVVGAADIEDRPVTSVTAALEGNAPGVQVNNSVSYPGSSPSIRIRGFNSFTGAQSPLYVVDGAVYDGEIAEINPADIESMSVLKDAASCALYGNRGANGVILITTKRAKTNGKVDVNLTINQGFYNKALPFYDRLNADEWMNITYKAYAQNRFDTGDVPSLEQALASSGNQFITTFLNGANIYDKQPSELFDAQGNLQGSILPGYTDLDWWDAISQTGYRQEYNVNASGATDKFNVFSSIGYLKENGYIMESDFSRFNGRLVANYNPVSYFKTGVNLSASYTDSEVAGVDEENYSEGTLNYTTNPFLALSYAPVQPYYRHNADGSIMRDENGKPMYSTDGMNVGDNVAWSMRLDSNKYTTLAVNANAYATAVLPYGFEVSLRGSFFRSKQNYRGYSNNIVGSQANIGGLDVTSTSQKSYTFMQQLSWNHDYGLNNIDVFLDHENYEFSYDYQSLRLSGQLLDNKPYIGNFENRDSSNESIIKQRTESYLGRVKYNYDQKYFAEASIRRDGTSRFAKGNRWGTFWSVGAGWVISKEKFMQNVDWVNFLKLRFAYGSVGNDAAAGSYASYPLYYMWSYDNLGNMLPTQVPADDIRWESTKTLDVALEGSLFNDRFTFSIGYYDKINSDLLYEIVRPSSAGMVFMPGANIRVLSNIGEMENYGWELQFGVDIIRNRNLTWNFTLDASFLKNKINKLPDGKDIPGQALFQGKSLYERAGYTYSWAGVDQATGNSLYKMEPDSPDYWRFNDDGSINPESTAQAYQDRVDAAKKAGSYFVIDGEEYTNSYQFAGRKTHGTSLPTVYGSFGTTLKWKGINFGMLFTYSLGGKTMNGLYNSMMSIGASGAGSLHRDILNAWTEADKVEATFDPETFEYNTVIDKHGVPSTNIKQGVDNNTASSRFLFRNDYLVLKNLAISYDFPSKWVRALKMQNINVGFSVDNLFIVTAKKGMNPQYSFSGGQGAYYMPARVFNFSLGFKF